MKPKHQQLTHLGLAVFAAAMVFAAPAAHAFTYETKSYNTDDSGLPPGYTDPDKKVEQFGSGDVPAKPGSGTTFHFEVKPSNNGFDRSGRFAPAWGSQPFPDGR
jgi:hypothetical protein